MAKKAWGGRFEGETDPRVETFTESISFDKRLAPYDIRVNSLAPGSFETDLVEPIKQSTDAFERYLSSIPMGRMGQSDDVKGAAVFLASDASRYVTGQTLIVDGGCAAWGGPHV